MKTLNVPFDDEEYDALVKAKGSLSWHDFIMLLVIHTKKRKKP